MAIPKIVVYIRKNSSFYAAPKTPDFGAVYYFWFYEYGKERKQKVGHVDLLPRAKVLLGRRLFANANGFLLPEAESVPGSSLPRIRKRDGVLSRTRQVPHSVPDTKPKARANVLGSLDATPRIRRCRLFSWSLPRSNILALQGTFPPRTRIHFYASDQCDDYRLSRPVRCLESPYE